MTRKITKTERKELNNMVCGSSLCREECYFRRQNLSKSPYQRHWGNSYFSNSFENYLIYDGTMFRCNVMEECRRITPKTGKLRWSEADALKQSILKRRIKLLKNFPEFTKIKLVRSGKKVWVDVDGREVSPRWFSHSWWKFHWDCEDR